MERSRSEPEEIAAEQGEDGLLEQANGRAVRQLHDNIGPTIHELSRASGISPGMLSKIERGSTSPSLSKIQALSRAPNVPVTAFFRGFEKSRNATHVRRGEGLNMERRGTRAGHQYSLLGHVPHGLVHIEPYLIALTEEPHVFPVFRHPGLEFIYMLEGEMVYGHAGKNLVLRPGDALFFDSESPHGPEELRALPIRVLSVIGYTR